MIAGELIINKRGKQPYYDRIYRLSDRMALDTDRQNGNFVSF
jgi:hypothetical protein